MRQGHSWLAIGMALGGTLVGVGVWVGSGTRAAGPPPDAVGSASGTATAIISRRDLVNRERLEGTLGYLGSGQRVINQAVGTITAMAEPGSVVVNGNSLYEVDGQPVILMYGSRPAWRSMLIGTKGPDVLQLEQNLITLGFASSSSLRVDGSFGASDAAAVTRWQKSLGLAPTGQVELGRIVFLPGPLRIGARKESPGDNAGQGLDVLEGSSTTRVVTVDLDASKQSLIKVGDAVEITVGGRTTTGTVSSLGKVATPTNVGPAARSQGLPTATVSVVISLADASIAGDVDQAPAEVAVITESVHQVLTVPISSLLATADGGYAVEVAGPESRRLVAVTTGLFDDQDSLVEIQGRGLTLGMRVVVPQ